MKKRICALLALAAMALPTLPAGAQVVAPSHVKFTTVRLGHMGEDKVVPVTLGEQTVRVTLSECQIRWADGDEFYALSVAGLNPRVVSKHLMDVTWEASKGDWDTTVMALGQLHQFCRLDPAE